MYSRRQYGMERHSQFKSGLDLHVCGSRNLLQTLLKHDLVDEFWLRIYPLTLGSGKRLLAEGTIPAAFKPPRFNPDFKRLLNAYLDA